MWKWKRWCGWGGIGEGCAGVCWWVRGEGGGGASLPPCNVYFQKHRVVGFEGSVTPPAPPPLSLFLLLFPSRGVCLCQTETRGRRRIEVGEGGWGGGGEGEMGGYEGKPRGRHSGKTSEGTRGRSRERESRGLSNDRLALTAEIHVFWKVCLIAGDLA